MVNKGLGRPPKGGPGPCGYLAVGVAGFTSATFARDTTSAILAAGFGSFGVAATEP